MKLRIIIIAVLLLAAGSARAQEDISSHFSVKVGAGLPGSGTEYFTKSVTKTAYGMEAIYGDYTGDLNASPAISLEAYYIRDQWFRFGLDFIYGSYSNQVFSGITNEVRRDRKGQSFIILPTAAVNYYHKNALNLYMELGVGAGYYSGFDNMEENVRFDVQFTPLGIEYGRKLFGFAEAGLGTAFSWVRGGIGYRF